MKTFKLYTLGCKVNQYESQAIREQFLRTGLRELNNGPPADIYLINTCTVTHRADARSLSLIRRAKRENPKSKVIVTGCLTELDKDRIRAVNANCLIVKNRDKENLLNCLSYFNSRTRQLTNFRTYELRNLRTIKGICRFAGRTRAFLKIQDGCNNCCSYCKVPLVRGPSRSRPLDEIIAEAERLVKNGYKEIVLTGICLGSYGRDLRPEKDIVEVIQSLEKIDGLLRIRLSSIEAGDVSEALVEKMADSKKLCPHLHIPIQSGDDEILKIMNRNYRHKDYLGLIRKIKKRIPAVAITTDVIVGFPGEGEGNFKNTVELVKKILPLRTHIFPYSIRKETVASSLRLKSGPREIKSRFSRLNRIAKQCSGAYQRKFINRKMNILIEGRVKKMPGFWEGYAGNYIRVLVNSERNLQNQYILLKLNDVRENYLLAAEPF